MLWSAGTEQCLHAGRRGGGEETSTWLEISVPDGARVQIDESVDRLSQDLQPLPPRERAECQTQPEELEPTENR